MSKDYVESSDFLPKYYRLYQIIQKKIDDGEWLPYQAIPAERELEELYNVSRTTVRKTLDMLVNRNVLLRKPGKGTFVTPPRPQYTAHELLSYTEGMRTRGFTPGQEILQFNYVKPGRTIRETMELNDADEETLLLERVRLVNGEPIGIHKSYVSLGEGNHLSQERLEETQSLYLILEQDFGLVPTEAYETIEAAAASEREAGYLKIEKDSPILLIKRTVRSQNQSVIEYVEIIYRANRYKYFVNLYRMNK